MFCEKGKKHCLCADCVRNIYYAKNTPHPCSWADCDICTKDTETFVCNQYLNLEELNKRVAEMQRANASYFDY